MSAHRPQRFEDRTSFTAHQEHTDRHSSLHHPHPRIIDGERGAGAIAQALEQLVRVQFARSFVHGLKPAQWHALRYFAVMPEIERSVTAFARHRASTMGTASTTITTLVRKGYLGRAGGNTRNSGLYVTEAGHQLLRDDPINDLLAAIAGLEPDERAALERALPKLVRHMAPQAGG
jgi:DNA-binding MarR family transcriptional regulator